MRLELSNFMSHASTELELPDEGIILVRGVNGAGKSAVTEALSYALWGKTLRGANPWHDGTIMPVAPGALRFTWNGLEVDRSWSGKQQKLSWGADGKSDEFETRTKAQNALEAIVGPFDLWRRSCVFSSSDAASFSTATDADRKRMLEKLLGLEWFDDALKLARSDFRGAKDRWKAIQDKLALAGQRREDLLAQIDLFATQLDGMEDPADCSELEAEAKKQRKLRDGLQSELSDYSSTVMKKNRVLAQREQALNTTIKKFRALQDNKCHECGQDLDVELREVLEASATTEKEKLEKARTTTQQQISAMDEDIDSAQKELNLLTAVVEQLATKLASIRSQAQGFKKATRGLKKAQLELDALTKSHEALTASFEKLQPEVAELDAVERILGLRGVRAHILGSVLGSIEAVANTWLAKLSAGTMSLELSEYTEKKAGGMKDAISLRVRGGDFQASSGGERRRVDVSLLLALSQVTSTHAGWPLIFDEVFDALDEPGITQVIGALKELAKSRPVVVITHSWVEDLATLADITLTVDHGEVTTS